MVGTGPVCPVCKHHLALTTTHCPACKKTIPKKYIEKYTKGENMFWVSFLGGFLIFLALPLLLYDILGGKWVGITIVSGVPLSLIIAYFIKQYIIHKEV